MTTKITWEKLRRAVQLIAIILILFLLNAGYATLTTIIIAGSAMGIILGKVFCRWFCPMGLMMEFMMGMSPDRKARSLYQYHKVGCPIAWISGLLNRISLLTVRRKMIKDCRNCGLCDRACYISTLNKDFSLYKNGLKNPSNSFTCSRCLACVDACPTGHLAFTVRTPGSK